MGHTLAHIFPLGTGTRKALKLLVSLKVAFFTNEMAKQAKVYIAVIQHTQELHDVRGLK